MKVVGLYLVRNEVDLIEVNLLHHFATAIDEAIVVDNGSTDGTLERVASLAKTLPIRLASEPGPYDQSARVTAMARLAVQNGAQWVLPIDADGFRIGTDATLRSILREVPSDVSGLCAQIVNFVQRREELVVGPKSLLSMTWRPPSAIGPIELCEELVESQQIGFVEMMYPPKVVSRASPDIVIGTGNHGVQGIGDNLRATDRVLCLHAPLRARSLLSGKIDQGRRVIEEDKDRTDYWHVRRWWRLARDGAMADEWAANSYQDGAITVGKQVRTLVEDTRIHDAVREFIPESAPETSESRDALSPTIAAYLVALDTVPGWFSELDLRIFVALDQIQGDGGIHGDLFEVGVYCGKSAILLGHLANAPAERLVVCDLFEDTSSVDEENLAEFRTWYSGFRKQDFEDQYLRFHAQLPTVLLGPSTQIDSETMRDKFRFIHVDGSHTYDIVRQDIRTAERLLGVGGIVAFDDISTAHNPGSALAVWEEVLSGRFVPLCLTSAKLYGTWDRDAIDWLNQIDGWVARQPDVECEIHTLHGWPVRRLYSVARSAVTFGDVDPVPSLDGLAASGALQGDGVVVDQVTVSDMPRIRHRTARKVAHLVAPPIIVSLYRRSKQLRSSLGRGEGTGS